MIQGRKMYHRHTVRFTETMGMKGENKDMGRPTERARITIIEGGTVADGITIIRKTGDLTIDTWGMRGTMTNSIFADIVCLRGVAEMGTMVISGIRDGHILLTINNRDMMIDAINLHKPV